MSGRRQRGTGSVRQLLSGRWQARFTDHYGQLRSPGHTFDTRLDADAWLAENLDAIKQAPGRRLLYKPEDVAAHFGTSRAHIMDLIRTDAIEAVKIGKMWRVVAAVLDHPLPTAEQAEQAQLLAAQGVPRRSPTPADPPCVYYIRFADRVKIGTTTRLAKRLRAVPCDELLAVESGGYELEAERHRQFAATRLVGEWFQMTDELLAHIAALRASGAVDALVPS